MPSTSSATSSGCIIRSAGPIVSPTLVASSVFTVLGRSAVTRTPCLRTSAASDSVSRSTAAFDAAYAAVEAAPFSPAVDATLTMSPRRRAIMPGSTARVACSVPSTFTRWMRSHSSGSISSTVPNRAIPALLTRTSISPSSRCTRATAPSTPDRSATSAAATHTRAPGTVSRSSPATRSRSAAVRATSPTCVPARASA